jgi:hypothetical protein
MHRRIVVAVATLLFSLLAFVVAILTDLHDRTYPESLNASSTLHLDFSQTGVSDEEVFVQLAALSDQWGLQLVKVLPELSGDQRGQIFVPLGAAADLPDQVGWFGNQPQGRVEHGGSLDHSFATGTYLVTGDPSHLDEFEATLAGRGTQVQRVDASVVQGLRIVVEQGAFRTTLVAGAALMAALALFWLAVKARGRALRVLGGVSVWRIQLEDLGGFLLAMVVAALPVTSVAVTYIAVAHGPIYVPYYLQTLILLQAVVIGITMSVAVVVSLVSWPSVALLATRRPAVASLQKASTVLKAATFVFMIATVGPVWTAYTEASTVAAQQAQWRSLADQVVLRYPGALGEEGFQALMADVGEVVRSAEERGDVAMCYAFTRDHVSGGDFGDYSVFAIVNQEWLDLMLDQAPADAIEPVSVDQIPSGISHFLTESLPLWTRPDSTVRAPADFTIYQSNGSVDIPLASGGGGELIFPDRALILVTPTVYSTFDDDFLSSLSSSSNLVFSGLEPTIRLLAERDLHQTVRVNYAAEDGVLRAQLMAYLAWLRGASLVGLLTAFAIAAGISAFIHATLRARRDFLLRLAGKSWPQVLAPLLAREWAIGVALIALIALMEPPATLGIMLVAAVAGMMLLTSTHFVASRWSFAKVSVRRF